MQGFHDGPGVPDLPAFVLRRYARRALTEDLGRGDVTTDLLVGAGARARARIVARAAGVVAGVGLAREVFRVRDDALTATPHAQDGDRVAAGAVLLVVEGSARAILSAERVALNYLGRLSGIATLTALFVEAVVGTGARIVDTRKTTPGLRALEKYAVRCGGGANHRFALDDGFLLKDNHRAALRAAGMDVAEAVRAARARLSHTVPVEVEVDTLAQLGDVLAAEPDAVLLDNMPPEMLREAVALVAGHARTEASGGITLDNVRSVAEAGVDLISVGALTHSAPALDVALDFVVED
ncbi:MAG: carboxylating nicotinate-nucleotide diphosphorylase [Gemmatimonadota bacterium]|jgi:nicotinate-nucleotide pyrophosphorylase (carboxylating)